ncbi:MULTISPECIES: 23S rRNA (pseudouridine(1915)-N(3))-methyltransferase RlmH [Nitratiruptor]|uniref:Ribosomal RNA large subunit methyltransferase H n=1 Tax=Nitratiruptor tergarcus DSM 16512 TaxID=1069081 RepID=A0A1W1WT17_9BACT|nr:MULTISPECIES: 23S rRNA (pseudouridine(1915)-N(3))-methyltransferase RlmH [Nitratiruptor]BCD61915.1 23S rRNA (pseudouridine1915-N3)-methyltransferase [Nitratiruptor sp. YY08-13]BCD65850.1 23S rRNA (pseudouridine1915-N3)-methyltransferase [Nitratiruptor sp. YY08-26]SMC09345.1 23S rRNA (pseudouridine1915-N3)-methyltransferase [Nitratiruptor tergarcus DSM 16512]
MHKIALYSIGKKDAKYYEMIYEDLIKNAKKYATIKMENIFNKKINQAQKQQARQIYTQVLMPYLQDYTIALDPKGEELDSFAFAKVFEKYDKLSFFIGGAYGFEEDFLHKCDKVVSLSKLTMSHKVAKIVLLEQIFRALSIIHKHPYHK